MTKKRISKTIMFASGMMASVALLVGNTFAYSLVDDKAGAFSTRIIPSLTTYTVKFYDDDNSTVLKTIQVVSGHTIEETPSSNPELTNYVFDGWTTNITNASESDYFAGFDLEEEVFSDLDLYPRMATYGYYDGTARSLAGNTVSDKALSTTSIKVGTYYNGATKLFDTSDVTLQFTGTYSLTCGSSGSSWTRVAASSLTNWNVNRKISFTPHSLWSASSFRFAIYSYSSNTDEVWTSLTGSSPYIGYVPYNHTKYIFCAMKKSSAVNNWDNKEHQSLDIDNISSASFSVNSSAPYDNWTIDGSGNTLRKLTVYNVPSWTFNDGYYPTVWVWGGGESGRAFTISTDKCDSGTRDLEILLSASYTNYKLYRRQGTTGDSGSTTYGTCQNELGNTNFENNTYSYDVNYEGGWKS